jgi:hypothetical protein
MKKLFSFFFVFLFFLETFSQPTVAYFSGAATIRQDLVTRGGARFARFTANATGVRQYAFHIGTSGSPNYASNWRPYTAGDANGAISFNQRIDPAGNVNSARFNSGSGSDGNTPSVTSGRQYTFNIGSNTGDNVMSILETNYTPRNINTVTFSGGSNYLYENKQVDVTLSGTLQTGENIIIRWSTDNFTTSNFALANTFVSGSTYRGNISVSQANFGTGTVQFYVYTSVTGTFGGGANQHNHLTADYLTLNLRNATGENVSGTNFSYTLINEVASNNTGNWNTGGTWLGGTIPPANSVARIRN